MVVILCLLNIKIVVKDEIRHPSLMFFALETCSVQLYRLSIISIHYKLHTSLLRDYNKATHFVLHRENICGIFCYITQCFLEYTNYMTVML